MPSETNQSSETNQPETAGDPGTLRELGLASETRAAVMFSLSLTFLALLAALIVLWIDIEPIVYEELNEQIEELRATGDLTPEAVMVTSSEVAYQAAATEIGKLCASLLLLLWPLFWAEQVFNFFSTTSASRFKQLHPYWWVYCLVPPLRLCARRRHTASQEIWLPGLGFQPVNRELRLRMERAFSVPMIWIALLILPVLGLQTIFKDIVRYTWIHSILDFGTGLIWFAFAVEFVVMVSMADKKLAYCKKHWLDLAIILLPLISFLRSLRVLRASKLLKFGRLQQLSKLVRGYRLRGVAMRALRALMVLEVLQRLLRVKPEKRIEKLEALLAEKQQEMAEIESEIENLKSKITDQDVGRTV